MAQPELSSGGPGDSLRRILDSSLAILESRFELFATELQEEKLRLLEALLWALVGIVLGMLTLVMATATVVFLFWETSPLTALALGTLTYAAGTAWAFFALNNRLKAAPRPFADTIAEFDKDREWLQRKD